MSKFIQPHGSKPSCRLCALASGIARPEGPGLPREAAFGCKKSRNRAWLGGLLAPRSAQALDSPENGGE